jgi:hypothetical protein
MRRPSLRKPLAIHFHYAIHLSTFGSRFAPYYGLQCLKDRLSNGYGRGRVRAETPAIKWRAILPHLNVAGIIPVIVVNMSERRHRMDNEKPVPSAIH